MLKKTLFAISGIVAVYIIILAAVTDFSKMDFFLPKAEAASEETLTVWYWDNSLTEIFAEFAKENEHIKLDFVYIPNYDYAKNLSNAISTGEELPDICMLQDHYAGGFLDLEIWEDLSKEPYNLDISKFPRDYMRYATAKNGKLVAVPYNISASGMAYHSELMDKVFGLKTTEEVDKAFPTWDLLISKGAEYKNAKQEDFRLFSSLGDVATMLFNQTNEAYVVDDKLVKPERFLRYFEILHRLHDEGLVDDITQCSKKWYENFENSKFLFAQWSMWLTQNTTFSKNLQDDWKLTVPPEGSYKWGAVVCAIPQSSENKELAWKFLQFLALSNDGALANKNASCGQFIYWDKDNNKEEFRSMKLGGFGDFDVGEYYFSSLEPNMFMRGLSPYDSEINAAYHTAVKAIPYDKDVTPEDSYKYFKSLLKEALPHIDIGTAAK